jgi:aspartate/methionine/tyrosine aminotransferase
MPNKRQRLVSALSEVARLSLRRCTYGSFYPFRRSSQMIATSDLALKVAATENGVHGAPGTTPGLAPGGGANNATTVLSSVSAAAAAAAAETFVPQKERTDVKSPQLPFGENVAVATGPLTAQ